MFYLEQKLNANEQKVFQSWMAELKIPTKVMFDSLLCGMTHSPCIDITSLDEWLAKFDCCYKPEDCTYKGEIVSLSEYINLKFGKSIHAVFVKLTEV